MNADLITEATFAAWSAWARHTPVRWNQEANRPEDQDEAMRRRFASLPDHVIEENEAIARAVLRVAEAFHTGAMA